MEMERARWGDLSERDRAEGLWWVPPPMMRNLWKTFRRCVRGQLEDVGDDGFVLGTCHDLKWN